MKLSGQGSMDHQPTCRQLLHCKQGGGADYNNEPESTLTTTTRWNGIDIFSIQYHRWKYYAGALAKEEIGHQSSIVNRSQLSTMLCY